MNEVPIDFALKDDVNLESIEDGMRAVESNMKIAVAILAVSLGRIKKDGLYRAVAPNFKSYLQRERTTLSYQKAVHLAAVGEKFWEFRTQLIENEIKLSKVMSKVRLLEKPIVDSDPMIWDRIKSLSYREFKRYVEKQKSNINVYSEMNQNRNLNETVSVSGAGLYFGSKKVKGLNLNEARREIDNGKRLVAVWVDDDKEARQVRKVLFQNKSTS